MVKLDQIILKLIMSQNVILQFSFSRMAFFEIKSFSYLLNVKIQRNRSILTQLYQSFLYIHELNTAKVNPNSHLRRWLVSCNDFKGRVKLAEKGMECSVNH